MNNITNSQYFHQIVLLFLVLIAASLQYLFNFSAQTQLVLFFALTLSIGMLHGMLDIVIFSYAPFKNWRYLMAYTFAVLALILLLLRVEILALPILLLLSVWHFGEPQRFDKLPTNSIQKGLQRFTLGANSLAAAFFLQTGQLSEIIFGLNQPSQLAELNWFSWSLISWVWLFALFAFAFIIVMQKTKLYGSISANCCEILVVWLAFALLPIWLAFALYFAGYHAIRHIRDVWYAATSRIDIALQGRSINVVLNIVLVGILVFLIITYVLWQISPQVAAYFSAEFLQAGSAQWLRMLIIVLAAVTLPHAILVHGWRKQLF